ncbi:DUF3188 domain-containing protein [Vagococcus xieshaowenii]|uniref:DUF3188 domain-containing protein n=1 Tax=Vagococcus xieshaowenii TaxID=2562451 RepID=A0A4Z0D5E5_9ENTE|nr:DUF3188 domain-containing protein [Vagococcus xieshaowenii]QCA29282.1 DUF3188 domain-containing protein [Vagococcus xieshaowenii]QCA29289.1 DUF3188 domain-containing protein [Vagococcus xieshaowenii]TFZ39979.1 DUF3188 domain-containing protein [Vagococcus xieshaowenii]TFZ42016.1 DUF3188 domain-containing protein [Vagococcus xieshaowenii]
MMKNGLFLISIGLIMFMFCVNRVTLEYDFLLMTTAVTLIIVGGILSFRANKKAKQTEVKSNENR